MNDYNFNNPEELLYLETTLNFIKKELTKEQSDLDVRTSNLIASRRDMWQESAHSSNDFDKVPEMTQYLSEVNSQTDNYDNTQKRIEKYIRVLKSPYFGRFDFQEEGLEGTEKIYIGTYNLIDYETDSILVYDWRSPISSIFYQCEIGKASYNSPVGIISGHIFMKRQYKIQNSKLKYSFDSSIRINDEILQEVLGHNSSSKMKNIVETIQKEQDIIIRDTENELLIVQGVAGSGKTSIALHRIAFLLYVGMESKISSSNVIIISPNSVFSKYISGVLPELGEENVDQTTFDDIVYKLLGTRFTIEYRNQQLESLITLNNHENINSRMEGIKFKGSETFIQILDRLIYHFEHSLIDFQDIYYDGKVIETKEQIKNLFLNNKIGMPISKRLKRIENRLLDKVHPLRKVRLEKIEKIVQNSIGHDLEIKSFSRLLSIKETKIFLERLHKFTKVDYMTVYKLIFNNKSLLLKLSNGLELPRDIEKIVLDTKEVLDKDHVYYEDCAPLLYIKLRLEGSKNFSDIRQVVIDEAQDYYPLQYQVFKLLFNDPRYTVLGDFNQSLEKQGDKSIYDDIQKILHKRRSVKLFLNKSYRSSVEINSFTQKILNNSQGFVSFDRHETEPIVIFKDSQESLDLAIVQDIDYYKRCGYESIAVICKTQQESEDIQERLRNLSNIKLLNIDDIEFQKGTLVIPTYMAKGLEFDVVLVYNVSKDNYTTEFDRRLLYIACTRALHKLAIYYTGEKSQWVPAS
jgi:DNA helicase-2/ATP-dependent DNA helicase PcrA